MFRNGLTINQMVKVASRGRGGRGSKVQAEDNSFEDSHNSSEVEYTTDKRDLYHPVETFYHSKYEAPPPEKFKDLIGKNIEYVIPQESYKTHVPTRHLYGGLHGYYPVVCDALELILHQHHIFKEAFPNGTVTEDFRAFFQVFPPPSYPETLTPDTLNEPIDKLNSSEPTFLPASAVHQENYYPACLSNHRPSKPCIAKGPSIKLLAIEPVKDHLDTDEYINQLATYVRKMPHQFVPRTYQLGANYSHVLSFEDQCDDLLREYSITAVDDFPGGALLSLAQCVTYFLSKDPLNGQVKRYEISPVTFLRCSSLHAVTDPIGAIAHGLDPQNVAERLDDERREELQERLMHALKLQMYGAFKSEDSNNSPAEETPAAGDTAMEEDEDGEDEEEGSHQQQLLTFEDILYNVKTIEEVRRSVKQLEKKMSSVFESTPLYERMLHGQETFVVSEVLDGVEAGVQNLSSQITHPMARDRVREISRSVRLHDFRFGLDSVSFELRDDESGDLTGEKVVMGDLTHFYQFYLKPQMVDGEVRVVGGAPPYFGELMNIGEVPRDILTERVFGSPQQHVYGGGQQQGAAVRKVGGRRVGGRKGTGGRRRN